jgi:hypothetical protein
VFTADSNKKLQVFHSFKNAGGTLLRPDSKLMCLLGTGASAVAIQVDSKTLMADCSLITLTIDAICKCTTAEETGDITTTDKNV